MYRNWTNARLLCQPDDGGGAGGDSNSVEQSFQRALDRKSQDGVALAREMFDDNYQMRRKNKELSDELTALRGKVPAEGAVVLGADEAKDWQAYRELGAVADVKQGLEQRTQLQGQLEETARETTLRTVAEAAGYKPKVLADLDRMAKAQGKTLAFDVREQTVDGLTVRVPFVKDGDKDFALSDYAAQQWNDFLPALASQATQQQTTGTPYPRQHPGGDGKPVTTKDVAAQFCKNRMIKRRRRRIRY